MKKRVLANLKKMRNPEKVKNHYETYLEEAITYIENTNDTSERMVDANWLMKRALDDMFESKISSTTFNRICHYINEYSEEQNDATSQTQSKKICRL